MSHLSQQTVKKAPLRSLALNELYKRYEEDLEKSICFPSQDELSLIARNLPNDVALVLNDNQSVAVVCWLMNDLECENKFSKYLMDETWKEMAGEVRDQKNHVLCWCYVATDLVSGLMKMKGLHDEFIPLSTWHVCAYCNPSLLARDIRAGEEHDCYGNTAENGIINIQVQGGYREINKTFDCTDHKPPLGDPLVREGYVKPRRIETLEEALEELKKQPVGADLINYSALFVEGKRVYYGPKQFGSYFKGYHSVVMLGVTKIDGELVVICKLSNGDEVGDYGYVYVSLATLYIPVGVDSRNQLCVRGYSTPMHLLTNFVVPELIINEDEDEKDDDEKDDDKKDDEKEKDEKEEDDTDNPPKPKRPRLSKPTTVTYGSSSFTKRTGTHQRSRSLHPEEEEEDSMESGPKDGIKVSYSVGDAEELNLKEESWVSIPNQILKTLQTIREITGKQHSDEDIYAVYIECFNDPNETAHKLLSLDTFHEVKNKRDKKKENVTQGSSRNGGRIFPNQGYGRNASFRENHVAGGFRASRPVSNRGRNFVGPRTNRVSGPSGVGNGKAEADVVVSVEKGVVEEQPPAKASFASVISAEPKPATKAIVEPVAKALEPVVNNEPKKLQPFTFGRQDTWEQVTENGTASNEGKDQSVLKADVGERANVTFPFHIQAAKKLQNGLTFGSFGSNFVKEVSSNISASGGDESFESSHETGDVEEEDSSPATNGIPEVVSAREGASSFSDGKDQGDSHSTSENDQIVQPVEQALTNTEAHQIVYGHGAPLSMFGLVPSMPALGQPVNTEGAKTQNGTPNASLATYPQQDQLFRQQYQPFFMPPPYIHQYMAPNGIPQQTYYHPGPALAAPSPSQPIGNTENPPITNPSPQETQIPSATVLNTICSEPLTENVAPWIGQGLGNLQVSSMYNLALQSQLLGFQAMQAGHGGLMGMHHPTQPMTASG